MINKKGFTLLEMLAVMAILGIVFSIGYVSMQSSLESTQRAACQNKLALVASAEKRFFATQDRHSVEFENLTNINKDSELVDKMYLDWNQNDNFNINVEIETESPLVYRLSCSEFNDIYLLQEESEYRRDYFLSYSEELPIGGDEDKDEIDLEDPEDPEDIISENVFVFGTILDFKGSNNIEGDGATVYLEEDLNSTGSTDLAVTNIYLDGNLFSGGGANLGSQSNSGDIIIAGDVVFSGGNKDVYGDLYVYGDLTLAGTTVHGNVYVNGNANFSQNSSVQAAYINGDLAVTGSTEINNDSYVYGDLSFNNSKMNFYNGSVMYYRENLSYPANSNYYRKNLEDNVYKDINVVTVELEEIPDISMPALKEPQWYQAEGYNYVENNPDLVDGLKVYSDSYLSNKWIPTAENVIIVAKEGNISISKWNVVTGILFAPNGRVTFSGERFEGLVIARDGFYLTNGGTEVIFRNATEFVGEDSLPFIP